MIAGWSASDGAGAGLASPCINVCKMDAANELCIGCLRTLDEIVRWAAASDDEKREILAAVTHRRSGREPTTQPAGRPGDR